MTYTTTRTDTTALTEAVRLTNLSPRNAHVVRTVRDRTYRHTPVTNLGWLLRNVYGANAKPIESITIYKPIIPHPHHDAVLAVLFEDGTAYATMFADRHVLADFLDRPSLSDVEPDWRIPSVRPK